VGGALHNVSKDKGGWLRRPPVEQTDGRVARRGRHVHVPQGGREILVPSQLLDRLRGRPSHGEVRTEGVPEDVKTTGRDAKTRAPLGCLVVVEQRVAANGATAVVVEHTLSPQMAMAVKSRRIAECWHLLALLLLLLHAIA
jgi:hypothetical protein